jgi:DUF3037 family protein
MSAVKPRECEFFVLRYLPHPLRGEFVNLGVVLLGAEQSGGQFAGVRFAKDMRPVQCLDPNADLEYLHALQAEVQKRLADATDREAFLRVMRDSFSGGIQVSASSACATDSPEAELEKLAQQYLERTPRGLRETREPKGRLAILRTMVSAFEHSGAWPLMDKRIPASRYTQPGDPLEIDCGYRPNGTVKMFHAVALKATIEIAKGLAFSYPRIAAGIARIEKADAKLTAVVEDGLDHNVESIAFAFETFEQARIKVATVSEMPQIAEVARKELRA